MPDDRVSIDNLTTAPDLGSNDVLPVVHEVNGVKSTFKATLTAIGTFINKILNYSADLQTTNKTVIGAINELHNGGGGGGMSSDIIADTYDDTATYNTGDYCIYNDGLYVCDDDNVTGAWDSTKWTSIQVMSSIPTNAELLPIESGSSTNTKSYIDSGLSGKANTTTLAKKSDGLTEYVSISGNTIDTQSFSVNDATYGIICGFAVTNTPEVVVMQCYFDGTSTIYLRVRNVSASTQSYKATIYYI